MQLFSCFVVCIMRLWFDYQQNNQTTKPLNNMIYDCQAYLKGKSVLFFLLYQMKCEYFGK